jgi:hypothetical protein
MAFYYCYCYYYYYSFGKDEHKLSQLSNVNLIKWVYASISWIKRMRNKDGAVALQHQDLYRWVTWGKNEVDAVLSNYEKTHQLWQFFQVGSSARSMTIMRWEVTNSQNQGFNDCKNQHHWTPLLIVL